jgi:hypothetical protein
MRLMTTIAIVALTGVGLAAQDPTEERLKRQLDEVKVRTFLMTERVPLERVIKDAPYSAETLVESSQTLADGNRINRRTTGRVYRDSEGRTRREEDRPDGLVSISIVDPVAGVSYSLDPENHLAWKTPSETSADIMKKVEMKRRAERAQLEAERRGAGEPGAETLSAAEIDARKKREAELEASRIGIATNRVERGPAAEEHKESPLERKTLEGVVVEGRRSTTTIRAGAIGNDLPIAIASEEWSSPDLKVLVMTRRSDPRTGESSYKLTNIVRAEPDRSLFVVPSDYTVKETGIRKFEEQRER